MKSNFFKVVLPAVAIMIAITLSSFTVNDDFATYYYDDVDKTGVQNTDQIVCDGVDEEDCTITVETGTQGTYKLFPNPLLIPGQELRKSSAQ